jgi:methylated-DNA-[protein]-cysteine S-methyltransferase
MEQLYRRSFDSPIGEITVCCSDQGVREVTLGRGQRTGDGANPSDAEALEANGQRAPGARWARRAAQQLQEYLRGQRKEFTLPLDLKGTRFQRNVWNALCEVPYGETRSYGEIARHIGNGKAARAVGMANHANPVAIVVPCHRVIASDGSLGGYAGGVRLKSRLLRLERAL